MNNIFNYIKRIILFLQHKQKYYKSTYERDCLIREIQITMRAVETAYSKFENVIEPDLIDSSIYELNAAQSKYKYLLNRFKELEEAMIHS